MEQPLDTSILMDEMDSVDEIILPEFKKDEPLDSKTQTFMDDFTESFLEINTDEIQKEQSFPDENTINKDNYDLTDISSSLNTTQEVLSVANQIKNFKHLNDKQKTKLILGTVLQKCTDSKFNLNLSPQDSLLLNAIGSLLTTQKLRVEDVGAIIAQQQLGFPVQELKS